MQPHKAASRRHFETESKRRTQHAPFRNHVSDSLYQGQLESLHDSITRLQESNSDLDYSNRAFEILKKAKSNSNFIVKDLVWFVGSKKGAPDDETVFRFFNLLFTFASLVERFISDSTQEESTLEASEISMQIWNDITRVISLSRKNHNDRKYTSRKTTSLKLSCGDVHDHYCVIMKSFLSSLKVIETQKNIPGYNYGDMTMKKMISLSKCLVEFVSAFGSNLDSVEHIEVLIRDVLLVILELDTNIYNQSMTNHILQLQTGVMECIIRILKWKHHSTRILITNTPCARMNGNMQLEINPLRDRLLKCINRTLNSDVYHQDEHYPFLRNTCQCLTKLLENIYNLDTAVQKHEHSKTGQLSTQIEVSYVFKWIHLVLQSDKPSHDFDGLSLKYCSLELLHVVIGLYPMSCAQFWALFLPQTRLQSKTSTSTTHYPKCTHHNVDLISLIDSIPGCMATSDEKVLAMDCCRQLIITLPLNLWSSTGYMNSRLEIALGELIRVTLKNLSNPIPMKQLQSSYALAETIIKCIPYDNYESLIRPAVHLISMIGQNYTKYGLHGGTGMIENVRTLTECLGGKETPSGNSTLLPLPSKIWLEGNDSTAFLDRLYNKISEIASYESIEKGMEATLQMELFIRMVKIIPNLRKDVKMDTFTNMAVKLLSSDDDTLQLTGSKLVRAYVEGRKVSISDEQSIPISVGIHLRSLLHFSDDVKCCVLSAYGSLRFCDWRVLLFEHCNPLQVILSACIECNEPNEKVRGEACKAIGNMISVCIKESNSELVDTMLRAVLEDVIDSILHVTTIAVHDSDANVRSMVSLHGLKVLLKTKNQLSNQTLLSRHSLRLVILPLIYQNLEMSF